MSFIPSPQQQLTSATDAAKRTKHGSDYSKDTSRVPVHPISQLQGPFEESIIEATEGTESEWMVVLDAQSRRRDLLESIKYERLYHPFWKLVSQISFGIYLLANRLAKSDSEVLRILQGHVDELDGFLGRTIEDFLIIQIDVRTRIQYLSLPLQNLELFDEMLQDRNFRLAVVDYNEKIEHAVERFTIAVGDSLKDMQKGKDAIGALWQYLKQSAKEYGPLSSKVFAIYDAMLANTEGWNTVFSELRHKGVALHSALSQLGLATTEMQRRVGVASRKEAMPSIQTATATYRSKSIRGRLSEKRTSIIALGHSSSEKPLPRDPCLSDFTNKSAGASLWGTERHRITRKSAPNLRALHESHNRKGHATLPHEAESLNSDIGGSSLTTLVPRIQRNLSRRFSKARSTNKGPESENVEIKQSRPATAPCKALRSRSISLEQLTSRKLKKDQQHDQQDIVEPPPKSPPRQPYTARAPIRRETMINQLLHYFKSDRVFDDWESTIRKEKVACYPPQRRKEGPCSEFCATSTTPDASGQLQTEVFGDELERSMAWLQGNTSQNTYSLKLKRHIAPRIHALSVHMTLAEELEEDCGANDSHDNETTGLETHSIITALPCVPSPLSWAKFCYLEIVYERSLTSALLSISTYTAKTMLLFWKNLKHFFLSLPDK
ncbi:hypothetical protein BDV23DRAFT_172731 [Aspergillus alliaceus]|uniref:Uncharacterized protein n=1 Tax=Petromyces alliaceus TaxID=209559 RepID=A0A5N7C886_PETAA|nr:hypothetical protein BDV23DRAFT_172731 [Aspergillus alliaceus]